MDSDGRGRWDIESWTFGAEGGVPVPVAPYAHATAAGPLVFVTGQLPIDAVTNDVVGPGDVTAQTHQVMSNLKVVLERTGSSLDQVLMSRVYLTSFELYERVARYRRVAPMFRDDDVAHLRATTSTSTRHPRASAVTPTQVRLGRRPLNQVA